jgi:hypothetical protein
MPAARRMIRATRSILQCCASLYYPMSQPIIEARDLDKFFRQPDGGRIEVIAPTKLAIYPGTIVALLGPSGSGKIECPIAGPTIRDGPRTSGGSWLGTKLRNDGTQVLVNVAVDNGLDPVELLEQDDLIHFR